MKQSFDRRTFLRLTTASGAAALLPGCNRGASTAGEPSEQNADVPPVPATRPIEMARFPEKADLILLTDRPPQLETPLRYFREDLTPNDAFFVRWHLGLIPPRSTPRRFACRSGGT